MRPNDEAAALDPSRPAPARIAVDQGEEPGDWQMIYDRLNASSHTLSSVLAKGAAAGGTFLGLFAVAGALALIIGEFIDNVSPYYLAFVVVPPAILAGAAAGQTCGNIFLRLWFDLNDASRRGFATRLTLARAPAEWPEAVRRWLFTGDWLGSPTYDIRLPYVRIFVLGSAPETCAEEDAMWREIHGAISGDSLWEAGSNHREISYPRQLPRWAREVGRGDGFQDLQKRIGSATAVEWVEHLWRRACRQWPALGANAFPAQARRECFEIHSLALANGREALAVVLRPSSFVAELGAEARERQSAAA